MADKQYTYEEVKKHLDNQSSWIVIHNSVYDVTAFLNEVIKGCLEWRRLLRRTFLIVSRFFLRLYSSFFKEINNRDDVTKHISAEI